VSEVHAVCTRFHTAIELLGARWAGAILRALFTGSHRFADIRAAIPGVSDVMLTRRLRDLEEAGLIERQVIPDSPVHVEYHLTEMGRDAGPVLDAVIAWSHRWIPVPPGGDDDSHPGELASQDSRNVPASPDLR
jgi:DNA-binding HxlR family transcriptional regulator